MGNVNTENNAYQAVLKYPGSKWRLANWIISHFPPHKNYIEPFFGSGAVLFNKALVHNEIANDIDGNVVNLFKVIREHGDELAALVEMTPYARSEFETSLRASDCHIEQARKFLTRTWQAFGSKTNSASWANTRSGEVFRPRYWSKLPDRILDVVQRLKTVQFENCCALELIERCNHPDTLLYLDPPYLSATRSTKCYENEFDKESGHKELLQLAKKHKGYIVISTYDNELYSGELEGWGKSFARVATHNGGSRVETIYISPNCKTQISLF